MSTPQERADRAGLAGFGCLGGLVLSGFTGGAALVFLGVSAVLDARTPIETLDEASGLVTSLEGAVAMTGFGALGILIGIVSAVVLLKELADDAARRERGAVRDSR